MTGIRLIANAIEMHSNVSSTRILFNKDIARHVINIVTLKLPKFLFPTRTTVQLNLNIFVFFFFEKLRCFKINWLLSVRSNVFNGFFQFGCNGQNQIGFEKQSKQMYAADRKKWSSFRENLLSQAKIAVECTNGKYFAAVAGGDFLCDICKSCVY